MISVMRVLYLIWELFFAYNFYREFFIKIFCAHGARERETESWVWNSLIEYWVSSAIDTFKYRHKTILLASWNKKWKKFRWTFYRRERLSSFIIFHTLWPWWWFFFQNMTMSCGCSIYLSSYIIMFIVWNNIFCKSFQYWIEAMIVTITFFSLLRWCFICSEFYD